MAIECHVRPFDAIELDHRRLLDPYIECARDSTVFEEPSDRPIPSRLFAFTDKVPDEEDSAAALGEAVVGGVNDPPLDEIPEI
jgi:hypothetical protein